MSGYLFRIFPGKRITGVFMITVQLSF